MSIIIFLIVLSILILVHEAGHFFAAKRVGVSVERFALGFGPKLLSLKRGGTEYAICVVPFGGYVKMAGDERSNFKHKPYEYLSKRPFDRLKIVFAGAFLNYVFAFLLLYVVFVFGYPTLTTKIGGLLDDFPAKNNGLKIGDEVVSVDGVAVQNWEDMSNIIREKKGDSVYLEVLRDGGKKDFSIPTKLDERPNIFGQKERVGLIGIAPMGEIINIKHGALQSFKLAWDKQMQLTTLTYKSIWMMLTGSMSFKETVSGPLGIFHVTTQAASFGILPLIHVMAVISLSLAIFNLLPIPILDGGHIVFITIEAIRKRPLNEKLEEVLNQIGLVILLLLVIFVSINDLQRFGAFEKLKNLIKLFK